jgi:hypothetical protein
LGQTKAANKPIPDVFYTDESIFPAGPYYNVRAGRARISEQEIVVGEGKLEKGGKPASTWVETTGSSRRS